MDAATGADVAPALAGSPTPRATLLPESTITARSSDGWAGRDPREALCATTANGLKIAAVAPDGSPTVGWEVG
jgi:hypothetical protein